MAHRIAWQLLHGPIPDETPCVLHHCDVKACVNAERCLFLGTMADNMADRDAKGRQASGDRSGARLHPERLRRGDNHPLRLNPGAAARGIRHGSVTKPGQVRRGETHGRALLTDDDVRAIRDQYAQGGISQAALGAAYGVDQRTVSLIVLGKGWKHIV